MIFDKIIIILAGFIFIFIYWNYAKGEISHINESENKKRNIFEISFILILHILAIILDSRYNWMAKRITDIEAVQYMIMIPIRSTFELAIPVFYLFFYEKKKLADIGFKKIKLNATTIMVLIFGLAVGIINYLSEITNPVKTSTIVFLLVFSYQYTFIEEWIFRGFITRKLSHILKHNMTIIASTLINTFFITISFIIFKIIEFNMIDVLTAFLFILITRCVLNLAYMKTKNLYLTMITAFLMNNTAIILIMIL